ncbi:MAG: hypothetical protein K9G59_18965 [Caulobacter sp.]|nr:hypothetical protein [Caulobacter sp.]
MDWDPECETFLADGRGEPSERDVWAAAAQLVKAHGPDAVVVAARRADHWLAAGDLAQYRLSKRILSAIDHLITMVPPVGSRPN